MYVTSYLEISMDVIARIYVYLRKKLLKSKMINLLVDHPVCNTYQENLLLLKF